MPNHSNQPKKHAGPAFGPGKKMGPGGRGPAEKPKDFKGTFQ